MTEAMTAEFGTVAEWTARVATALGPAYYLPAGCRGSGSPPALDWLIASLRLGAGHVLLDSGAGVGGPAAYAAERCGVQPLLVEPQAGACRAASALFDLPVVQASGSAVPFADDSVDAAWSLGVLCTAQDQLGLLGELSRVVRQGGGIGLLVYVATTDLAKECQPEGNSFPTATVLADLVDRAGMHILDLQVAVDLGTGSKDWQRRTERVDAELSARYCDQKAWQLAEQQSRRLGELITSCAVVATLFHVRHQTNGQKGVGAQRFRGSRF